VRPKGLLYKGSKAKSIIEGEILVNNSETLSRSFSIAEGSVEKLWDMWLMSLGSFSWSQEQMENAARKYLDERKIAREDATKLIEELTSQTKNNQQQFQKMIQDAVINAFENINIPTFNYIDDLSKKIDDLSKKVQQL
jgi:polyhydroxyalkanoate synthesis regulator phasin